MILDTFYLLFKTDSQDLQKGSKEAIKTTDEVNKKLKETGDISDRLGHSFSELIGHATGFLTAILSVGAIEKGIEAATEYTHNIGLMSDQLGYSAEVLDAWGGAVEKAGGSAYYFQYTVQSMDIALGEMAKTGGDKAQLFKKLGINIKDASNHARSFIDLLPEISKSFSKMDKAKSSDIGYKLGLDYGTIMLLQKGSKEVQALIDREKELGVVTKQDTDVAEKFKNQQKDTQHAFRSLFVSIATEVLPIFQRVSKFFEETAVYLREHKNLVIGTVLGISGAIAAYLIPSLLGVGAAGSLINKIFSKWFFVIAIIGAIGSAIGVLYDDFITFRKGGESVIGDLVKKFPELKEIFDLIGSAIDAVKEAFKEMNISPFGILIKSLNFVAQMLVDIYKGAKVAWDILKAIGSFGGKVAEVIVSAVKNNTDAADDARNNAYGVASSIASFDKSAIGAQTSSAIANGNRSNSNTANVTTGPVTINTQATNSDEIANSFSDNLKKHLDHAQSNYDDGVFA